MILWLFFKQEARGKMRNLRICRVLMMLFVLSTMVMACEQVNVDFLQQNDTVQRRIIEKQKAALKSIYEYAHGPIVTEEDLIDYMFFEGRITSPKQRDEEIERLFGSVDEVYNERAMYRDSMQTLLAIIYYDNAIRTGYWSEDIDAFIEEMVERFKNDPSQTVDMLLWLACGSSH